MIYFIQNTKTKNIKIGYTSGDARKRLKQLQTGSDAPLRLLGTIDGDTVREAQLHKELGNDRIHGEWFKPSRKVKRQIAKGGGGYRLLPSSKVVRYSLYFAAFIAYSVAVQRYIAPNVPLSDDNTFRVAIVVLVVCLAWRSSKK